MRDRSGVVIISKAAIINNGSQVQLVTIRSLNGVATLQSGTDASQTFRTGTNICDSDPTVALDSYSYTQGQQLPWENIPEWNGQPLIGQPYPMNNYLAVCGLTVQQQ